MAESPVAHNLAVTADGQLGILGQFAVGDAKAYAARMGAKTNDQ